MRLSRVKNILLKNVYRIAYPFRKVYWWLFEPKVRAVRALVFWESKILVCRISYGPQCWVLPGGGVKKNESFQEAARREVLEEVGVNLSDPAFFYEYFFEGDRHQVQCFFGHVHTAKHQIDETEISEARWVTREELAQLGAPLIEKILFRYDEWVKATKV